MYGCVKKTTPKNFHRWESISYLPNIRWTDTALYLCCDRSSDRPLMVDLLSYFLLQPVLHN